MTKIGKYLVSSSLILIAALMSARAKATDLDVNSAVDAVTVYPDGASVTRIITLDLPSGDNTLVARDFPISLDPSSLRVEGEAGAQLTIGTIDTRAPATPFRTATALPETVATRPIGCKSPAGCASFAGAAT